MNLYFEERYVMLESAGFYGEDPTKAPLISEVFNGTSSYPAFEDMTELESKRGRASEGRETSSVDQGRVDL